MSKVLNVVPQKREPAGHVDIRLEAHEVGALLELLALKRRNNKNADIFSRLHEFWEDMAHAAIDLDIDID